MFNRTNIFKKNWEFQKIIGKKIQVVSKNLIIYITKSEYFKIGISIPKQFVNAVKRNHFKNQIKSILRKLNVEEYKFECVLIARKTFFDLDFSKKAIEVKNILESAQNGKAKKI